MFAAAARAWNAFPDVLHNIHGNRTADNYQEIVEELLLSLQALGCRMSIKVLYLQSHLCAFPGNLGDVSKEQGERSSQVIQIMDERYQGRRDSNMMADHCWALMKDIQGAVHR